MRQSRVFKVYLPFFFPGYDTTEASYLRTWGGHEAKERREELRLFFHSRAAVYS